MKIFNQIDYSLSTSNSIRITPEGSDYTFLLDRGNGKVRYTRTYLNRLDDSYQTLVPGDFSLTGYSNSDALVYLYNEGQSRIEAYRLSEGTSLDGAKLMQIDGVLGIDHLSYSDLNQVLYTGASDTRTVESYTLPFIPQEKATSHPCLDATVLGGTIYLVGSNALTAIDVATGKETTLKSYTSNPYRITATTVAGDKRLYILRETDTGIEEYLVGSNSSTFYVQDAVDPYESVVAEDNRVIASFQTGISDGNSGLLVHLAPEDDPSNTVPVSVSNNLFQGLKGLALDESRQYLYLANASSDLLLVLDRSNGYDPLSLVTVGTGPEKVVYNPLTQEILCLCNGAIYVVAGFVVQRQINVGTGASQVAVDPNRGFLLVGYDSGECQVLASDGTVRQRLFPQVGAIHAFHFFDVRGSELLIGGDSGVVLCSLPGSSRGFAPDQARPQVEASALAGGTANQVANTSGAIAVGYSDGNVELLSSDRSRILTTFSHSSGIQLIEPWDPLFFAVSSSELTLSQGISNPVQALVALTPESWGTAIIGNAGDGGWEILLVGVTTVEIVPFSYDPGTEAVTLGEKTTIDLQGELGRTYTVSDGYYVPKSFQLPAQIEVRDSFALRRQAKGESGPKVIIERESDNNTLEVGLTSDGKLDESQLSAFIGNDNAGVRRIYGAYGRFEAYQPEFAKQPLIAFNGTILRVGEEPAMDFDGQDDYLIVDDQSGLDLDQTVRISAYLQLDDVGDIPQTLFSKGNYYLQEDGGTLSWETRPGTASSWAKLATLGSNPSHLTAYRGFLYASCPGSDEMYFYDSSSWRFLNNLAGSPGDGAVFNDRLYICCPGTHQLNVYDETNWTKAGGLAGVTPEGTTVYDSKLWVTCRGSDEIYTYGGIWDKSGDVGAEPVDIMPFNGELLVACHGDDSVWVLRNNSWQETSTVDALPVSLANYNGQAYVACQGGRNVFRFSGIASWSEVGTLPGENPGFIKAVNGTVYLGYTGTDTIGTVSLTGWDGGFAQASDTGQTPSDLILDGSTYYAVCSGAEAIYRNDGSWSLETDQVGTTPVAIAGFDSKLYVAAQGSSEIYVRTGGSWSLEAQATAGEIGSEPVDLRVHSTVLYALCRGSGDIYSTNGAGSWTQQTAFSDTPQSLSAYQGNLVVVTDNKIHWLNSGVWEVIGDNSADNMGSTAVAGAELNSIFYLVSTGPAGLYKRDSGTWSKVGDLEGTPQDIAVSGGKVWIACSNPDNVYIYDETRLYRLGKLDDNPNDLVVYAGELVALCTGGRVYGYTDSADFWREKTTTPLGELGNGIVVPGSPSKLVFTRPANNDLYQWDGASFARFGNNTAGTRPIDVIDYNGTFYTACAGSNDLYYLDGNNDWVRQADTGLNPGKMAIWNSGLRILCRDTDDVITWDGAVSRLDECGYDPLIALSWDNGTDIKLLVACDGLNGVGKGVYAYDGANWTYHGSIGDRPSGGIVYNGAPYFACAASNALYAYTSGSWTQVAVGGSEIGEEPTRMAVFNGYLYLCCQGATNEVYRFSSSTGWERDAIDVGIPEDLAAYEGKIYSIDSDKNHVYASDGTAWSQVTTLDGSAPKALVAFSSKLHAVAAGSNEAFLFPSYLLGQTVSQSVSLSDTFTLSAEFGEQVRLFVDDAVETASLPKESPGNNNFNFLIGVGFDFSPSGNITIRGDNFQGRIAELQVAASGELFDTDVVQSYLYGHHIASGNYYLYDQNQAVFIRIDNQNRTVSTESSPLSPVESLIYDDRFGTVIYGQPQSLSIASLNKRVLRQSPVSDLSLLATNPDFTVYHSNGLFYFIGRSVSAVVAPQFSNIATVAGQTLGLDEQTSYVAEIATPDANIDRRVVRDFDPAFITGGNRYYQFDGQDVTIYDTDWVQQATQTLATSGSEATLYYESTEDNGLNTAWIFVYDGVDLFVYSAGDVLSSLKTYSDQPFYSPIAVHDRNEVWFIANGSLRRTPASSDASSSTSVSLVSDLAGEFQDNDRLADDQARGLVVAVNRRRKTLVDYTVDGKLVNEYPVSRSPIQLAGGTAFAYDRLPVDLTVSGVDGYLYCLCEPVTSSQFRRNEVLVFSDGRLLDAIPISPEYGACSAIRYSSDLSAVCVEAESYILCFQNRTLVRVILKASRDFLDIHTGLSALQDVSQQGWNLFDLGGDLKRWFDATTAVTVQRNASGVRNWLDRADLVKAEQPTASLQPDYTDLSALQFDGGQSLTLSDTALFESDLLHLAFNVEGNGLQTLLSNDRFDLTYRDEELTLTAKGQAEGFYPVEGTQGSPRAMAKYNGRLYLAVAGKDEIWKHAFTVDTDGYPKSLPKWEVFQSDSGLVEPEHLYEYDGTLYCCYAYSDKIASVEATPTVIGDFSGDSDKVRPRRMIEYQGNLYVAFFGSNQVGKYDGSSWTFVTLGDKPYGMTLYTFNTTEYLLVACAGSDQIWRHDGSSWEVWANSTHLGEGSGVRGLYNFSGVLFAACSEADEIRRYDGSWSADSFSGSSPVNFAEFNGELFVCCRDSDDIHKITGSSDTAWNGVSTVGSGPFELATIFRLEPDFPRGSSSENFICVMCADDLAGRVYYSKGEGFSSPSINQRFTEFNGTMVGTAGNDFRYFNGLWWITTFTSSEIRALTTNSSAVYLGSGRNVYRSSDGIRWDLVTGFEAENGYERPLTAIDGKVYFADLQTIYTEDDTYPIWVDAGINTGDPQILDSFVSKGDGRSYLIVAVWDSSATTKLWTYDVNNGVLTPEYDSSQNGILGLYQDRDWLYIAVGTGNDFEVYRADISAYDPATNGNYSLSWTLVGDGTLPNHPKDLQVYNDYLYVACGNAQQIYRCSLSGDITTNPWNVDVSLSGERFVGGITVFQSALYALVVESFNSNSNAKAEIWHRSSSWSLIDSTDSQETLFDTREYKPATLSWYNEYNNRLFLLIPGQRSNRASGSLLAFDGSALSSAFKPLGGVRSPVSCKTVVKGGTSYLVVLGSDLGSSYLGLFATYLYWEDGSYSYAEPFRCVQRPNLDTAEDEILLLNVNVKNIRPFYRWIESGGVYIWQEITELTKLSGRPGEKGVKQVSTVHFSPPSDSNVWQYFIADDGQFYRWRFGVVAESISVPSGFGGTNTGFTTTDVDQDGQSELYVADSNGNLYWSFDGTTWPGSFSEGSISDIAGLGNKVYIKGGSPLRVFDGSTVSEVGSYGLSTPYSMRSLSGELYVWSGSIKKLSKGTATRTMRFAFPPPNDQILALSNPQSPTGLALWKGKERRVIAPQGLYALNSIGQAELGAKGGKDFLQGKLYGVVGSNFGIPAQNLLLQDYLRKVYGFSTSTPENLMFPFQLAGRKFLIGSDLPDVSGYATTYQAFKDAVENARDGDTVYVTGYIPFPQPISVSSTITIVGDSAVFDGQGLSKILDVPEHGVEIDSVLFKNGYYSGSKEGAGAVNARDITFRNCTFYNNRGVVGAVRAEENITCVKCRFVDNASTRKGRVYRESDTLIIDRGATLTLHNCFFLNRIPSKYQEVKLQGTRGNFYVYSCNFNVLGDALFVNFPLRRIHVEVGNCVFHNVSRVIGTRRGSIDGITYVGQNLSSSSNFGPKKEGPDPIVADPLFTYRTPSDDYRSPEEYYLHEKPELVSYNLDSSSPAKDAGDKSVLPENMTTDLLGNPRVVNGTVDIGAIEVQDETSSG